LQFGQNRIEDVLADTLLVAHFKYLAGKLWMLQAQRFHEAGNRLIVRLSFPATRGMKIYQLDIVL
jgi:hypothetical protein